MAGSPAQGWEAELDGWLAPFLARLGRKTQRCWAPFYLKGLILPGERKSIEPMAALVAPGDTQQLHHFVSASPWATAPLEDELVRAADWLVGGADAVLVIDDTALVKQGRLAAPLPSSRREAAVLRPARQAGQLPVAGLADPGPRRGAGLCRPALVPT
jgi:hypothetical protein